MLDEQELEQIVEKVNEKVIEKKVRIPAPYLDKINPYRFNFTLPGSHETVVFKPLTILSLKGLMLLNEHTTAEEFDESFDQLIQNCILTPGFNVKHLWLQDRIALLMNIRMMSKGSTYEFNVSCPKCKQPTQQTINFGEMEVKELDKNTVFSLPLHEKMTLVMGFLTREDQVNIEKYQEAKEYKTDQDKLADRIFLGIASSIKKVISEGEEFDVQFEDAMDIIDNLDDTQFKKVQEWLEQNNYGMNMSYKLRCNHLIKKKGKAQEICGYEEEIYIPLENLLL